MGTNDSIGRAFQRAFAKRAALESHSVHEDPTTLADLPPAPPADQVVLTPWPDSPGSRRWDAPHVAPKPATSASSTTSESTRRRPALAPQPEEREELEAARMPTRIAPSPEELCRRLDEGRGAMAGAHLVVPVDEPAASGPRLADADEPGFAPLPSVSYIANARSGSSRSAERVTSTIEFTLARPREAAPPTSGVADAPTTSPATSTPRTSPAPAVPAPGELARRVPDIRDEPESAPAAVEAAPQSRATRKELERLPVRIDRGLAPAWELDRFEWPELADRLLRRRDGGFVEAGRQLASATRDGLHVLGVTSTFRGEGRTTVAMNLARAASRCGLRVALIDADLDHPGLAPAMGVSAARGWQECLTDGLPLDEAAVISLEDRVVLVPLTSEVRRVRGKLTASGYGSLIRALQTQFDLLVVDHGPFAQDDLETLAVADAIVLVRDVRCTGAEQALASVRRLREHRQASVGIAQNFQSTGAGAEHQAGASQSAITV